MSMTAHTQINAAAVDVAARLEVNAGELAKLCSKARRAGWTSRLDQLAAVLISANAPGGARGRAAADAITAAIFREGPKRQEEKARRARAAVARCAGRDWQSQCRSRPRVRDARGRLLPAGAVA